MKIHPKVLLLVLAVLGLSIPGVIGGVVTARAEARGGAEGGGGLVDEVLADAELAELETQRVASARDTLARGVLRREELEGGWVRQAAVQRGTLERRAVRSSGLRAGTIARGLVPSERVGTLPVLGDRVEVVSRASLSSGNFDPAPLEAAVLREANAMRHEHGSRVLVMDASLTRAASGYARELARRGEIEHISPTPGRRTFRERIEAEGISPRLGGENLARLTSLPESLGDRVVRAWLRSPGHRVNLLDPIFSRTGIGVWLGGDGVWYVVQVYATES
jgi:uncharacterized protein YkwD